MGYEDPASIRDIELWEQWLDSIKAEEPAPAPKPQCGQCINYKHEQKVNGKTRWSYCEIRAAADIHPCNLPPWDSHAEECKFYEEACPF